MKHVSPIALSVRLFAVVSMMLLMSTQTLADDLTPPPWSRDGASNFTTAAEWDFTVNDGTNYVADGSSVTTVNGDGGGGFPPQMSAGGDIGWVTYNDGGWQGGIGGTGPGSLNFRIANWIDDEPLKIVWMQMTYAPDPVSGGSPFIEFIIADDPLPITRTEQVSVTEGPISGDALGRWHKLEVWEIEPNPDFESIQIVVLEGVTVDQVVIDTISTVPEPTGLAMITAAGLLLARRRLR